MRVAISTHLPPTFGSSTSSARPSGTCTFCIVDAFSITSETRGSDFRYAAQCERWRGITQNEPSRHSCQQIAMYGDPSGLRQASVRLTPSARNSSISSGVMPRTLPRQVSFDSVSSWLISVSSPDAEAPVGLVHVLDQLGHPLLDPAVKPLAELCRRDARVSPDAAPEGRPDAAWVRLEVSEDRREGRRLEVGEVRPLLNGGPEIDEFRPYGHHRARLAD